MSDQEKEALKHEVLQYTATNLGRSYYKMSIQKILWLIGCTVSICVSVFAASLKVVTEITTDRLHIEQHTEAISNLKSGQSALWLECNNLQGQINAHITADSKK